MGLNDEAVRDLEGLSIEVEPDLRGKPVNQAQAEAKVIGEGGQIQALKDEKAKPALENFGERWGKLQRLSEQVCFKHKELAALVKQDSISRGHAVHLSASFEGLLDSVPLNHLTNSPTKVNFGRIEHFLKTQIGTEDAKLHDSFTSMLASPVDDITTFLTNLDEVYWPHIKAVIQDCSGEALGLKSKLSKVGQSPGERYIKASFVKREVEDDPQKGEFLNLFSDDLASMRIDLVDSLENTEAAGAVGSIRAAMSRPTFAGFIQSCLRGEFDINKMSDAAAQYHSLAFSMAHAAELFATPTNLEASFTKIIKRAQWSLNNLVEHQVESQEQMTSAESIRKYIAKNGAPIMNDYQNIADLYNMTGEMAVFSTSCRSLLMYINQL